jgi:flavodoxin
MEEVMSKNIIFYFTGTGNSLKVAKDVANIIHDCKVVSMSAYKEDDYLNDMERIGFVFPVYGSLPNLVNKFISNTEFPKNKDIYYFTVVTCGHFKWNGILKFLVQPNKVKQGGTNGIQENYVKRKRRDFSLAL